MGTALSPYVHPPLETPAHWRTLLAVGDGKYRKETSHPVTCCQEEAEPAWGRVENPAWNSHSSASWGCNGAHLALQSWFPHLQNWDDNHTLCASSEG